MTLLELIERLIPYFPKLPPEVAEFFGEVLLTGDVSDKDTFELRDIMYRRHGYFSGHRMEDYENAAINVLGAISFPHMADKLLAEVSGALAPVSTQSTR